MTKKLRTIFSEMFELGEVEGAFDAPAQDALLDAEKYAIDRDEDWAINYEVVSLLWATSDSVESDLMAELDEESYSSYLVERFTAGRPVRARMAW